MKKQAFILAVVAAIISGMIDGNSYASSVATTLSGSASMESGQIQSAWHRESQFTHRWLFRNFVNFTGTCLINDNIRIVAGATGKMWYESFPDEKLTLSPMSPRTPMTTFYITQASGAFSFFGEKDNPLLQFELGYFPFKYNSNARNLGEYLFRSGTYPPILFTDIDKAYERLAGTRLSLNLFNNSLHLHQLFTQELQLPSFFDFSLSYLLDYSCANIITVGGGVMFSRLISTNSKVTTPIASQTAFTDPSAPDSIGRYTFQGTKIMARLCFDPKRLFFSSDDFSFLGPEDLKLYGEAAILGLKDYKGDQGAEYYSHNWKRTPIMAGFNAPGFTFLDVIALELEYSQWDRPNAMKNVLEFGYPIPDNPQNPNIDYNANNWKWSVYAKKTFFDHFSVLALFARDHLFHFSPRDEQRMSDREEMLRTNKDWYWVLKFGYTF
ncbi:MAG: hypothetical protein JXA71_18180 [Chitinispirillaceae bacterium]|nr:hypothetical protein [Chitinispirillaceae bacterium]